jgi:hypothetical protein
MANETESQRQEYGPGKPGYQPAPQGYDSGDITSIRLQRGSCFGTCPVYDVTLSSDGTPTYTAGPFAPRQGDYTGEVGQWEFDNLAAFVIRAGFFSWKDEYRANVTDLPTYQITVTKAVTSKTVLQYGMNEPPDFWVIAEVIDGMSADITWTSSA